MFFYFLVLEFSGADFSTMVGDWFVQFSKMFEWSPNFDVELDIFEDPRA